MQAIEHQTGFKHYDDRCNDINSDFYKENAFCKEQKQYNVDLYEKMLKSEKDPNADVNESFLGKKTYRTTDPFIKDPRGETFPGITVTQFIKFKREHVMKIVKQELEQSEKSLNFIMIIQS